MNQTAQYIFTVLEVAQISISDFRRLTGISRQTLYNWQKGGKIADAMRLNVAYNWAKRIEQARVYGKLPMKNRIFRVDERLVRLRAAILGK